MMGPHADYPQGLLSREIRLAAGRGWRIVPVKTRHKIPLVKDWPTEGTDDIEQLGRWAEQFPHCNWGIVTGKASALIVIDVDGPEGRESVANLARQGLTLPSTLAVTTGREDGGEHLYYRMPVGIDIRNDQSGKIGPHIDVRATGGFVVCVPSIHASGKPYAYVKPDAQMADVPVWVIDRLVARVPPGAPGPKAAKAVGQGSRTRSLVSLAGTMNKKGASCEAIIAALLEENATRCEPPLPELKVRAIADEILRRYPVRSGSDMAQEDGRPPEFSDDSLALKFTERYGDDHRFTAAWGRWSEWDGRAWKQDRTSLVFDLARAVCRDESSSCLSDRLAQRIASCSTVFAVERLARADRRHAASTEQWDSNPWLLNTPGGVIDLRTGALRPANREDYMTKMTAGAPGGECPLFHSFLSRVTDGDEELQRFMQRMCGYCLTGETREHALFFLYGTGANGKSVFLNTISGLMGDYAKTAPMEAFIASANEHHPTDIAGFQGARLVTSAETEDGRCWAKSKLKALTGGDRISARFMRQDYFEYAPQFKLMVAGNQKPRLHTVDEAMRRRFNLLPFTTTIPALQRDAELTEKLRAEWGGILQWMIAGCLDWQSRGLQAPRAVRDATEDYFTAEDAIGRWIEDCCQRERTYEAAKAELFQSWSAWCALNQEPAGTMRPFVDNLEARGFRSTRTSSVRLLIGLRLVTDVTHG
jgi:putative DNA primase/helicase